VNTTAFRGTRFAFLWIALIPIALAAVTLWMGRQSQQQIAWISHTYDVRASIREIVLPAAIADRDVRNYLGAGQEYVVNSLDANAAQARRALDSVRQLTANSPVQQRNLQQLIPLVESEFALLNRFLGQRQSSGRWVPLTPAELNESQQSLDRVRDVTRAMIQEEERLLVGHSRQENRTVWQAGIASISAIALTLLLLFWASRLAKNYAAERDRAEASLQQKMAEIEALNRDLERRVEERTAALRESNDELARAYEGNRLLASIVESSDDAIVGKSLEGVIRTWNVGAERLYGYKAEDIIGHNIRELTPPDRPDEESAILERLRKGECLHDFETVRRRKDGSLVDVSLTVSPIRDRDGHIVGASHMARDITERNRNAERMRETQKLESLGVMAGGVAHDFNNLLVGVLGNASFALDQLAPDSPARSAIERVVAAGERAAALTQQMLAYSGRGRFVLERVDLSTSVRETIPLIQAAIPRTVDIELKLAGNLPAIDADVTQIQQLVMNLVINGAEAVPEGQPGKVTVATGLQAVDDAYVHSNLASCRSGELRPGAYVRLEVCDTGNGMDEATQTKIFEPFFTTKFTGRGLGLAAVQGIVRGHSGSIQVMSAAGRGTTFRVLFPALASPARRPEASRPDMPGALKRCTVLVIDDERLVRTVAQMTLEKSGYTVLLAEDGKQAIELFGRYYSQIGCVVLDLAMPVMDGEETLPRLISLRPDIPVILSSGFGEDEAVRRFQGKRLAGFLQKPYRAADLAAKVANAITQARFDTDGTSELHIFTD
jgi:PAS domain S-box-containing protein